MPHPVVCLKRTFLYQCVKTHYSSYDVCFGIEQCRKHFSFQEYCPRMCIIRPHFPPPPSRDIDSWLTGVSHQTLKLGIHLSASPGWVALSQLSVLVWTVLRAKENRLGSLLEWSTGCWSIKVSLHQATACLCSVWRTRVHARCIILPRQAERS